MSLGWLRAALHALGRGPWLVLLSYAVVVVGMTWPVAATIGTRVAGRVGDQSIALWDYWWLAEALQRGQLPTHTRHLFHPVGVDLTYHSISWTSALLALPFRGLFGAIAAYNIVFLLQALLCAAGMYALAKYLTRQTIPAWVAGLVFAFEPYRVTRAMQHPNLAGTGFIPLVFLCFLRAWREARPGWAWCGGLALALVLLTGAHLFVMTAFALGLLFVFEALGRRADRRFWLVTLHLACACVVCVGPLLVPYATARQSLGDAIRGVSRTGSTDLASLLTPSPYHPLFGGRTLRGYRFFGESDSVAYLGIAALALVVLSLVGRRTRRPALVWFTGFVLFLLLSLGPRLVIDRHRHGVWLPYRLISHFQVVEALRQPERFNLIARAFFAVGCAWGVVALGDLLRRRRLALIALPLIGFDYLSLPHPTREVRPSEFDVQLGKRKGGAILDVPLKRAAAKRSMLAQTVHHRPIVGGMIARTPKAAFSYIKRSPLLRSLAAQRRLDCATVPLRKEYERLRRDDVDYFVVRKHPTDSKRASVYETYVVGRPVFSDKRTKVYSIADLLRQRLPCDP